MTIADRAAQLMAEDECPECGFGYALDSCAECDRRHAATESRRAGVRQHLDRPCPLPGYRFVVGNALATVMSEGLLDFEPATCRVVPASDGSFGWVAVTDGAPESTGRPLAGSNSRDVDKIEP